MKDKPATDPMLEFYNTVDKNQEDHIDFLQDYILSHVKNAPKIWTSFELDEESMDATDPQQRAVIKRSLELSEKLRSEADLQPHRTFFMQNPRGELIFCLKLTGPIDTSEKNPNHFSIYSKRTD